MKLLQFLIIVAVIGSNGEYHWTPNGYVAGLVAVFAMLLATVLVIDSLRLLRWLLGLLQKLNHQETLSLRTIGQSTVHQLIGEKMLNRSRHDGATGKRSRDGNQGVVDGLKRTHALGRS